MSAVLHPAALTIKVDYGLTNRLDGLLLRRAFVPSEAELSLFDEVCLKWITPLLVYHSLDLIYSAISNMLSHMNIGRCSHHSSPWCWSRAGLAASMAGCLHTSRAVYPSRACQVLVVGLCATQSRPGPDRWYLWRAHVSGILVRSNSCVDCETSLRANVLTYIQIFDYLSVVEEGFTRFKMKKSKPVI